MRINWAMLCALLFVTPQARAEKTVPVPEPTEKPDWADLRRKAEASIRAELIDPESARFQWTSGFEWGYVKPALVKRTWGWVGCVAVNAKNRLGGYVGAEVRWFIYSPTDGYGWGIVGPNTVTQCSETNKVALQPELMAVTTTSGTPGQSVTDQLSKLADLLEKGLITRAEFDSEKSRLLH